MRLLGFLKWRRKKIADDSGMAIEVFHRYAMKINDNGKEFSIGFENACDKNIDRLIHINSIEAIEKTVVLGDVQKDRVIKAAIFFCEKNNYSYKLVE